MGIGVYRLLKLAIDEKEKLTDSDFKKQIQNISVKLNFSSNRIEKELSIYLSNATKMQQALELIKESVESERKKRLKRDEERKANSSNLS